jgi:ankyrin repeat protein
VFIAKAIMAKTRLVTALLCASVFLSSSVVIAAEKHLFRRGVDEIFEDGSVRSLASAAAKGDLAAIEEWVVAKHVAVDSPGNMGVPPLWWAAQRQNLAGFTKLLELGANPNSQWQNGESVMNYVVRMKSSEFLRAALTHGGDPNFENRKVTGLLKGEVIQCAITVKNPCVLIGVQESPNFYRGVCPS